MIDPGPVLEAPARLLTSCRWLTLASVIVVFVAAGLVGCDGRNLEAVGEPDTPFVLVLSPFHAASTEQLDRLSELLETESGLTIEVRVGDHSTEGISNGDAWLMPLFDYLFCQQEYGVEAGLRVLREGGSETYVGEIVVQSESDVAAVSDLEGRRIALVDRYSTSGFILPLALLTDAGVTPEIVLAGSHERALAELRASRVDAAAVYVGAAAGEPAFRSLVRTDEIPNEPVGFRPSLNVETRRRFSQALVNVSNTPEGRLVLRDIANITGFIPTSDDYYRQARTLVGAAGRQIEDLVPGGWQIHNWNQVDFAP